jgi:catechol 2,3-dioxygenase-like lactoylglutathione lyase family enzyme
MSMSHVRFLVNDIAADVAFYRDIVGLKQVVDVAGVYAEFDTGGSRLAFYRADLMRGVTNAPVGEPGGDVVVCLRVDDVDRASERLAAKGATLLRPPHDQAAWYQRVAHFADRSGRLIELWSPLATAPGA